ncbi:MAG TPA: hypothetical protein VGK67_23430 [Myxococcales bacterium]|jgi:hypothetical protein
MKARTPESDPRPRVLGVRLGANPNSSSLSVDVMQLLLGGAGSLLVGMVMSVLLRGRKPKPPVEPKP